jgi:hypothetical protein
MRALCGAIIAAGALIGLGLASLGHGTRYARLYYLDKSGDPQWVKFWQMDVALIAIIVLLICTLLVGLGIAILGLAYHHQRRHLEHLHRTGSSTTQDAGTRVTVS